QGVQLGTPAWPKGEDHTDEYFGTQEIYRKAMEVAVPFTVTGDRPSKLALDLKLQGCADAGLCFPPQTWKTEVIVPAANVSAPSSGGLSSMFKSKSLGAGKSEDEFLPPDEAFRFGPGMEKPDSVSLTWVIAEGYYLYKHKIEVTTHTPGVQLGKLQLPPAEKKSDETYGDTEV